MKFVVPGFILLDFITCTKAAKCKYISLTALNTSRGEEIERNQQE